MFATLEPICSLSSSLYAKVSKLFKLVTSLGLSSTSDVITFDQNWHHLYSTSAGGKDLSNDAQIRMIGLMESEICTKMLKKLSEKVGAKFPATTHGYSMVKFAGVNDAFLEVFFNCKQA